MSDLKAQQDFFNALCRWGVAIGFRGYKVTGGDYYRDPRATFPYSSPHSFHARRLAFDANLFDRDGKLVTDVEGWREAGELWESLGGTWGSKWGGDANHLSWGEGKK